MKKLIATAIAVLAVTCSIIAQVDRGEVELVTLTNTVVEQYDTNQVQLNMFSTESTSTWKTIWHGGMIEYTEIKDGEVVKEKALSIVSKNEDDTAIQYVVVGNDGNYTMTFWKDGSMVAYEFVDGYTLITGELAD